MKVWLTVLILLFPALCLAQKVVVASDAWEGYSENGTGYYFEVLKAIFRQPEYQLEFRNMPFARSVDLVKAGQADLVLGVYLGDGGDDILYSHSIVEEDSVDAIVSPSLAASWNGADSLSGKKVVAKIGYEFDEALEVDMNYSENAHVENMLKMLAQGRVDAVLDYETEVRPLWIQTGLNDSFKIQKGVIKSSTFFGFKKGPEGEALKKRFDEGFKALYLEGVIQDLYVKFVGSDSGIPKQY